MKKITHKTILNDLGNSLHGLIRTTTIVLSIVVGLVIIFIELYVL